MTQNIVKSSMINGLIMGVIFSINFLISLPKNSLLGFLSMVIAGIIVLLMYRMAVKFRDTECEGKITYSKTLSYIILTFFFGALIAGAVKFFYVQFVDKEYIDRLLQDSHMIIDSFKIPMDEEKYQQLEKMMSPVGFAVQTIWVNLIYGTITGLIMAFFVKKSKSIFE
ncbi:MAG: DUF4199 domain-containing protein [Paludibacter sp.]|nr:DUF4199 domain-containing protein [Paludibacter sp.]